MVLSLLVGCTLGFGLDATQIYRTSEQTVVQVRTAVAPDAAKRSYGSGFVVDQSGLIATNFHVIQEALEESDTYRIFISLPQKELEASIESIDIASDLALLKVNHSFAKALELLNTSPERGERLYSVGVPRDLNLSVVEGTFNGLLQNAASSNLLLSSPINPGMSGGPTLNQLGKVVGINVAILLESQNLSFAVPVSKLAGLVSKWKSPTRKLASLLPKANWNGVIRAQLIEAQNKLSNEWKEHPRTLHFGEWSVIAPPTHLKCWRERTQALAESIEVEQEQCRSLFSMTPKEGLQTGNIEMSYAKIRNESLLSFRFPSALQSVASGPEWNPEFGLLAELEGNAEEYSSGECTHSYVNNQKGIIMHASYCSRSLTSFDSLKDAKIRVVTLPQEENQEGFLVKMELHGFQSPVIQETVATLLESIEFHGK